MATNDYYSASPAYSQPQYQYGYTHHQHHPHFQPPSQPPQPYYSHQPAPQQHSYDYPAHARQNGYEPRSIFPYTPSQDYSFYNSQYPQSHSPPAGHSPTPSRYAYGSPHPAQLGPEGERGLGATLIGGGAGGYAGKKAGGGVLGAIGAAAAGAIGANILEHGIKKKFKKRKQKKNKEEEVDALDVLEGVLDDGDDDPSNAEVIADSYYGMSKKDFYGSGDDGLGWGSGGGSSGLGSTGGGKGHSLSGLF